MSSSDPFSKARQKLAALDPSGIMLVATGDLAVGLSTVAPPVPFVGEVGDTGEAEADDINRPMQEGAGGHSAPVSVNLAGASVATVIATAIDQSSGAQAHPATHLPSVRIDGLPCLVHNAAYQTKPNSAIFAVAQVQPIVFGSGTISEVGEEWEIEQADAGALQKLVGRVDFGPVSAEHVMASRTSTERLSDLRPDASIVTVGDPVDVNTGAVVVHETDVGMTVPFVAFERHYHSTRCDRDGALGKGWTHRFAQSIWLEPGRVVLDDAGRQIEFDCFGLRDQIARAGDELYDLTGERRLVCLGQFRWELYERDTVRSFAAIPGTPPEDRDRGLSMLVSLEHRDEGKQQLRYDAHARLERVQVGNRTALHLRYDARGRISRINDRLVRFEYSDRGELIAATDALGQATHYEYVDHLLVAQVHRTGTRVFYGYDGHGSTARCVQTWTDAGHQSRYLAYEGTSTVVTNGLNQRDVYRSSAVGLITERRNALGEVEKIQYDDSLRLSAIRYADKTHATDIYDDNGHRATHRDRHGANWSMRYDDKGHLVGGTDPMGGEWSFRWDYSGQLTRVEDPEGHVFRLEYERERLRTIIDPLGRATMLELGLHHEVLGLELPGGAAWSFEYSESGELTSATSRSGASTSWHADALGRLSEVRHGHRYHRIERDPLGRVVGVTDSRGLKTQVLRTPGGQPLAWVFDDRRIDYVWDIEQRLIRVNLDGIGHLSLTRDACGRVEHYNVDGMFEGVVLRQGPPGRVTQLTDPETALSIEWNDQGQLLGFASPRGTFAFEYRPDGLLQAYRSPDQAVKLERNVLGVVTCQSSDDYNIISRSVDWQGHRYGLDLDADFRASYLWSGEGRLDRIAVVTPSGAFDLDPHQTSGAPSTPDHKRGQPTAIDGLHRPIVDHEGQAIRWDEDRWLAHGSRFQVWGDRPVGIIDGSTFTHDGSADPLAAPVTPLVTAVQACFPTLSIGADAWPTPLALLTRAFARRVWNPITTPLAGLDRWSPDDWQPREHIPQLPPSGRLTQAALLRLLSPFPRPTLAIDTPELG